jgi:hypothetical protein
MARAPGAALLTSGALVVAPGIPVARSVGHVRAILIILFPELRANLQASYPQLGWGTGYGSAWAALVMVLVSFRLRDWPRLQGLTGGDLLLGREPFPLRRHDHTLFTLPLLASALWLLVRVDTLTFLRHFPHLPLKTAVALVVTGVTWTLAAVYLRAFRGAVLGVHFGWIFLFLGFVFGWDTLVPDGKDQWPSGHGPSSRALGVIYHQSALGTRPGCATCGGRRRRPALLQPVLTFFVIARRGRLALGR